MRHIHAIYAVPIDPTEKTGIINVAPRRLSTMVDYYCHS
jgi:hypothetical protein